MMLVYHIIFNLVGNNIMIVISNKFDSI